MADYRVTITTEWEEAVKVVQGGDVDLVILDIRMPNKHGFDVYKEIRGAHDTPVLFCTGYASSFNLEQDEVMDMWSSKFVEGSTDILYKPFDQKALVDKIESLI